MASSIASASTKYAQFFGVMTGLMAYGIHFTLFAITAHLLLKQRHAMRCASFYLAYICLQFILSSVGMWRDVVAESVSYVEHGDDPAGPIDYYNIGFRLPPEWVSVFMFAALTSILFIISVATTHNLYAERSIDLGVPYWALSISFNLVVTLLIIARLYRLRREARRSLTPDAASVYTSVGAMLVESAALYSLTGLVFIVCYARHSRAQYVLITWLGQFESISPLLIILRVAQGRAWSSTVPANVVRLGRMKAGPVASGVLVIVETITDEPGLRSTVNPDEEK
ncbi:hypothetical protein NEOLEDRAFT_1177507 [Neolentinus lepideus HHB14362 ss-1]|uniref:Uncharacterized protein n=1 Tax=Neolentinus lepideus HHB14362 ss-1 TaxID=1314782 RepID=A0A165TDG5_9AGAM|nr:hypothetical protein NEOLEDRAFT_1177507 [Neolentinus lepideus HHB14362 ss-1]